MTGGGPYNSEYRNFNRGHGRGNPRSFQSSPRQLSPQPIRRGDLFMEAGRLAVEYLVSHGILSSNVLSGKSQNGTLRNNYREFKDHRSSQDREIPNSPVDGRPVAIAHKGASFPEGVSSSRKNLIDHDLSMARSSSRDRRRLGPSRSYSSDWSRENGREGSFSDKVTNSRDLEVGNDNFPVETTKNGDTDVHNSHRAESASEDNKNNELQEEMEKCHPPADSSEMTSTVQNKDDEELLKPSDGVIAGREETKDETSNNDVDEETPRDEGAVQHCEKKNDTSSTDGADLLRLCPSANQSPKSDPLFISEDKTSSDTRLDSLDSTKDVNHVTINRSSEIPSSNEIPSSTCAGTSLSELSFMDTGVVNPAYAVDQQKPIESLSFTDKTFSYEQKSCGLPDIGSCNSVAKNRGEKRALEEENMGEGSKKAKQWLSVAQSDEYSQLSDLAPNGPATVNMFNRRANEENFTNDPLALKGGVESAMQQGEGKQLFSSSFKICDLNLMEASDMHESHDVPAFLYPSISAPNKDTSVDIDLSMNNNCSLNSGYNDCGSVRKDIEIIDLESASLQDAKSTPTRNTEANITSMGNFPNNSQSTNDNPDGQDGYGFMISELLGNDVPNCSSVQPDMNSLHNDMGLHNTEGMFSEDDPIYMSLGEIPISLLRVWEQPTQERNPFEL